MGSIEYTRRSGFALPVLLVLTGLCPSTDSLCHHHHVGHCRDSFHWQVGRIDSIPYLTFSSSILTRDGDRRPQQLV